MICVPQRRSGARLCEPPPAAWQSNRCGSQTRLPSHSQPRQGRHLCRTQTRIISKLRQERHLPRLISFSNPRRNGFPNMPPLTGLFRFVVSRSTIMPRLTALLAKSHFSRCTVSLSDAVNSNLRRFLAPSENSQVKLVELGREE